MRNAFVDGGGEVLGLSRRSQLAVVAGRGSGGGMTNEVEGTGGARGGFGVGSVATTDIDSAGAGRTGGCTGGESDDVDDTGTGTGAVSARALRVPSSFHGSDEK